MFACTNCDYEQSAAAEKCPSCGHKMEAGLINPVVSTRDRMSLVGLSSSLTRGELAAFHVDPRVLLEEMQEEAIIQASRAYTKKDRQRLARRIRRNARSLREKADAQKSRANKSMTVGSALGAAIGTAAIIGAVTGPISIPLIAIGSAGFSVFGAGLGLSYVLESMSNRFRAQSERQTDLAEAVQND